MYIVEVQEQFILTGEKTSGNADKAKNNHNSFTRPSHSGVPRSNYFRYVEIFTCAWVLFVRWFSTCLIHVAMP